MSEGDTADVSLDVLAETLPWTVKACSCVVAVFAWSNCASYSRL